MTEQTDETTEVEPAGGSPEPPVSDDTPEANASGGRNLPPDEEPETFPREYVVKLRQEAADHRVRASDRDALAERLHGALVAATGRLADPSDLPFDESHVDDAEALTAAIDELLTRKPHLASRRVTGDVGQGASKSGETVDLAGMLRARA